VGGENFAPTLELDVDRDGSWSEDITSYLLEASVRRGRRSPLVNDRPGSMTLTMQNRDGRFSPLKGTIANLDHDVPVRLYWTWTTPAITNLVINPAFTLGILRYASQGGASFARDTSESFTSSASGKVSASNVVNSGVVFVDVGGSGAAVTVGVRYTGRARVKAPLGKKMEIALQWINGGIFQRDRVTFLATGEWQAVSISIIAPATAATCGLTVWTEIADGVFDFFIDAVMFYDSDGLSEPLQPYVDGRQPGCTWSGTADDSTSSRSANPTFLMFQGFIFDFDLKEELDHTARIECRDRLAMIFNEKISMGILKKLPSGLAIERILDRVEGELVHADSWGFEWTRLASAPLLPTEGWSVLGAGDAAIEEGFGSDVVFEGDWRLSAITANVASGEGVRYDATTDLAATGDYDAAVYARSATSTVEVKFRIMRDAVEVASKTVTLTTAWQRIPLPFTLASLGTNRYFDVLTTTTTNIDFMVDDLHFVKRVDFIPRSIDAGGQSPEIVAAFEEPAGSIIFDVLDSEPGRIYVEAKSLANGDRVVFHDGDSRPAAPAPRLVLGDGDGLLPFALRQGLGISFDAADRVDSVTVTSRGTPVVEAISAAKMTIWQLSPEKNLSIGDTFPARYNQIAAEVRQGLKTGVTVEDWNRNFGLGGTVEITAGATPGYLVWTGRPLAYPTEVSEITKRDTALTFHRNLPIRMPLQATQSSKMDSEATRLLSRYKVKVVRANIGMSQQQPSGGDEDLLQAMQLDLELDDPITLRAKFESHSPNVDKTCWIEGVQHRIGKGKTLATVLIVEEI
jgi:hypothetical protein